MDNIRYTLGLDIGIASVGSAVIRNDLNGEPYKIERLGVRVFDRAEQPKTGASLALPRRQARGSRRVIRRRRHRKERIKWLIERSWLMSRPEQDKLLSAGAYERSVYELRVDALDRKLTDDEAVRLLIHFAQRRGYKSNSKSEEAKDAAENGKVKTAISANRQRMEENGYRTVGEMLWSDPLFKRTESDGRQILVVHNQPGEYKVTVERSMLLEELALIFERQREYGAAWASEQFEADYTAIWSSQRNFDEGPGGDSPYGGSQIGRMLGKCTFEKELDRAPKASYSAEYFRLLQTANNLKTVGRGLPAEFLDETQRKIFIDLAFSSASATYTQLRKKLDLPDDLYFNNLYYGEKTKEEIEKKKLGMMPFYHKLRTALNKVEKGAIENLTIPQRDEIAMTLLLYKSDDNRTQRLREAGIPEEYIPAILELSTSKAGHLSTLAMQKLLPYLEQGMTYDKACKEVYGSHDGKAETERTRRLHMDMAGEIANPVVRRAISQSIKVINAIVREYGPPETVRIELARELGKSFDERNKQEKRINENAARNEQAREQIREYKKADDPTGLDIVKFKLFQEQNGVCLYSGKNLDISRLFEAGYVDVDHIIPYSLSFDDSYNNKVLVLASENRQKGNRIPYDYFGSDAERWNRFETLVGTQIRSFKKRKNLLMRSLSKEQSEGFIQRNLVDTQYLSRVIFRLIDENLEFAETGNYKRKTQTVSGGITAQVRKRLGIDKIRENGDLHHAADAAVIACVSPGMIHKVTNYSKRCELYRAGQGYVDYETGEVLSREAFDEKYAPRFPEPWPMFRKELEARLSTDPQAEIEHLNLPAYDSDEELRPVFVSRMPRHKVTGAAHMETVRSGKVEGKTVTKTALTELKLTDGEIKGYYRPEDDPLLYEALKARLQQFGGNAKQAFVEPFYKPRHDGTPGPLVKKVKIVDASSLNVPINGGIAANGSMIRVDVFHVEDDGYYFVPVYVSDTVKKQLPNRAPVANKPFSEWKLMQDEDFQFSAYPGDLIRIANRRPIKLNAAKGSTGEPTITVTDALFYFCGLNISTGAIAVQMHDRSYGQPGLGGKTLSLIEKYQVDVLGNYAPVHLPEKRMGFR